MGELPAVLSCHGTCTAHVGPDARRRVSTTGRVDFAHALAPVEARKAADKWLADLTEPVRAGFLRESVAVWHDHGCRQVRFRVVDREGP